MCAYTLPWRNLEGNLLLEGSGLGNDFISMVLYTSNLVPKEEEGGGGVNLAPSPNSFLYFHLGGTSADSDYVYTTCNSLL